MVAVTPGGLSFFHAIPADLDRVKKKGTSTLDRPAKPTLKTPHPAPANCTTLSCSTNHSSSLFSFKVYLFYI